MIVPGAADENRARLLHQLVGMAVYELPPVALQPKCLRNPQFHDGDGPAVLSVARPPLKADQAGDIRAHRQADVLLAVIATVKVRSSQGKALADSLRCAKHHGIVCMTGMVGNKWSFDDFSPMDVIPTSVCLTTYDGGPEDFMLTPLDELVEQVAAGRLRVQVGKVFKLDDIVEAHRCMEENKAGGKIVVLT